MTLWMMIQSRKMWHILQRISENFLSSKTVVNLVIKGNSKLQEGRKENSKGKMEKNPNLHKMSLVLNATGMDTLRKNVRII